MTRTPSAKRKAHTLYRFWNADDVLLYIGITGDPATRWGQHGEDKGWWREVSRVTVQHFADRRGLEDAEVAAIRTEHPVHNTLHRVRATVPVGPALPVPDPSLPPEMQFFLNVARVRRLGTDLSSDDYSLAVDYVTGQTTVRFYTGPAKYVATNSGGTSRRPYIEVDVSDERAEELQRAV